MKSFQFNSHESLASTPSDLIQLMGKIFGGHFWGVTQPNLNDEFDPANNRLVGVIKADESESELLESVYETGSFKSRD